MRSLFDLFSSIGSAVRKRRYKKRPKVRTGDWYVLIYSHERGHEDRREKRYEGPFKTRDAAEKYRRLTNRQFDGDIADVVHGRPW